MQYQIFQRFEKTKRELATQQKNQEHQAIIQIQYGIEPPINSVSTTPDFEGLYTLEGGMDTEDNFVSWFNSVLSKFNKELKLKLSKYLSILRGDDFGKAKPV